MVTNSWKVYNDHLNSQVPEERLPAWNEKAFELFTAMLYAMSQALGYDFDEVQLKRDCYRPIGHGDLENQQYRVRKGIEEVLDGKRAIPMAVTYFPFAADEQTEQSGEGAETGVHSETKSPTEAGQ